MIFIKNCQVFDLPGIHPYAQWRVSKLKEFKISEFHYITKIANLQSIFNEEKILSRNETLKKFNSDFTDWSDSEVQKRRDKEVVLTGNNRKKGHDVVPLFFNANNPTLYVRKSEWQSLAVLSIDINTVTDKNIEIAFSKGNFSRDDSTQYHDLKKLNILDWKSINSSSSESILPRDPRYENYKTNRSSEFFIYPYISTKWIRMIYVSDPLSEFKVSRITNKGNTRVILNQKIFKE